MTREELLTGHGPSSMVLVYTGPYTTSDFFAYAIVRKAFFSVFSRNPGFYTTKNMDAMVDRNHELDFIRVEYKHGVNTDSAAQTVWEEFGRIVVSDEKIFMRVKNALKDFVDNSCVNQYDCPMYSSGLDFMFGVFNSTWSEDNDAIYDDGKKKMFYIKKKLMVEGIITASKILERMIARAKSDEEVCRLLDRAYMESVNGNNERLILIDGDATHVTVVINEPCHIHDISTTIKRLSDHADNIKIFMQANYNENDCVIGYVAQVVDHGEGFNFNDYYQYCRDNLIFDDINMISENGMVVGINSSDKTLILSFCALAYRKWYEEHKVSNGFRLSQNRVVPVMQAFNFTSDHDKEPEYDDFDVKIERAHSDGHLYDPLKDKLSDLVTKVLNIFKKED